MNSRHALFRCLVANDAVLVPRPGVDRRLVRQVNDLAAAVRRARGVVAWVTSHMPVMPKHFAAILGVEQPTKYFNDGQPDGAGTTLWPELHTAADDLFAKKSGASAFFPGKCNLKEQLDPLGIDTLLGRTFKDAQ